GDIGRGLHHVDASAHRLDLLECDGIDEILDDIDIARVDDITHFDLAFGVRLDVEELLRIGFGNVAGVRDRRPHWCQDSGAGTDGRILHQGPASVIKPVFANTHAWSPAASAALGDAMSNGPAGYGRWIGSGPRDRNASALTQSRDCSQSLAL